MVEVDLDITPSARFDIIDITKPLNEQYDGFLAEFNRLLFCSHHTTAGYLDQWVANRLHHDKAAVETYVGSFKKLFPSDSDYLHDQLHLRLELSEDQRCVEPRNADSHLTFMGSGLENCVTYVNAQQDPVYFIDLDGINLDTNDTRRRRTTVMGFNEEVQVVKEKLVIPVSHHAIDSINLRDPKLGIYDQLHALLRRYGITKGRIDIALNGEEKNAGLTVNEYETLLMQYDLAQVLKNPLRFMAQKGKHMLINPRAIPGKAKNYAKYDLVQVVNEFMDVMGMSESLMERVINKLIRMPASRFLRMKRGLSLPVSDRKVEGEGNIINGTYQSPILVQWRKAEGQARTLNVQLVRFE